MFYTKSSNIHAGPDLCMGHGPKYTMRQFNSVIHAVFVIMSVAAIYLLHFTCTMIRLTLDI
jgi:hypothetical protein